MKVNTFIKQLDALNIHDFIGVPDSTLKPFCDYLNNHIASNHHFVPVNEGAAVALAAGIYLGEAKVSCVYMQNSGIGNAINPIASLINELVYDIPMLFVIGYRGFPGMKDEPQHKFQGMISEPLLKCLNIEYAIIDDTTSDQALDTIFTQAKACLDDHKQFAIVVKKDCFEKGEKFTFDNHHALVRESAIEAILNSSDASDIVVSTTGKISREVYEQCDLLFHNHERTFLTVGSMGHASMIALGIAMRNPNRQVYCIDGDGAALMHMGSMAFVAQQPCRHFIHIVLNNNAHESVGGMPTNCQKVSFEEVAKVTGYKQVFHCDQIDQLKEALKVCRSVDGPSLIEVMVALGARDNLGRPKESAIENKENFMKHIEKWRS